MDENGIKKISRTHSVREYLNLNFWFGSTAETWNTVIGMFDERIDGRYMRPVREVLNKRDDYAFAAMALICLMIETFYQFRKGLNSTGNGTNKEEYSGFLAEIMPDFFRDREEAEIFYDDIRCGILHSGQTKRQNTLTKNYVNGVRLEEEGIHINVRDMATELAAYFDDYKRRLRDPNERDLRSNFVKKMDYLCNRETGKELMQCCCGNPSSC